MMHMSNVGTAPGTTVLRIPASAMMARGMGLGTVYPTDFDRAKQYDYLPYTTGWIPGRLDIKPGLQGALGAMTNDELEQRVIAIDTNVTFLGKGVQALYQRIDQIEVAEKVEAAKAARWNRRANAAIAIAAIGGLAVSIYSLRRKR